MRIDLNADLGEGAGHDDELLMQISSANISTGFHAGDPVSVLASIRAAKARDVAVGAHPSFDDRVNFGRTELAMPVSDVFALCVFQLGAFAALCRLAGARLRHVKPHGALYNMAARDGEIAGAIVQAICAVDSSLLLFAPPKSQLARAGERAGVGVICEVFADRNYLSDGSLVSRSRGDALLDDPGEAAARVLRMLREGVVRAVDGTDVRIEAETICVHGDTPDAVQFARALRTTLEEEGIVVIAAPGDK